MFSTNTQYFSTTYIFNSTIFTTKNKELVILGQRLSDIKQKLIDFNDIWMQGGRYGSNKKQIIPGETLIKELSFDEAKTMLDSFNASVVNGNKTLDEYFKAFPQYDGILRTYVTTTDQQAQSTQGLVKASQEARATQIAQNEAIQASTLSAKAATVATKALAIAGNMLLFWGVTKVIQLTAETIDNFVHHAEKAIERTNELKATYQTASAELASHQKTVYELADSYEKLSKGVDTATNTNLSLSTEDYQSYLDITNELADTFPSLHKTLDDNGNAILTLGQNGRTASEDLALLLQTEDNLNNYKISQDIVDLFGGVKAKIDDARTTVDEYTASSAQMEESFERIKQASQDGIDFSNDYIQVSGKTGIDDEYFSALSNAVLNFKNSLDSGRQYELGDILNPTDIVRVDENGIYDFYLNTFSLTEKEKEQLQNEIKIQTAALIPSVRDNISSAYNNQAQTKQEAELEWKDFIPSLVATMKSTGSFQDLADGAFGEDIQNFAVALVSNLDYSIAEQMEQNDPYGWVRKNVILPLTQLDESDRKSVVDTYNKLLELNPNDMSEQNQAAIDKSIRLIAEKLGRTESEIRLNLGFGVDSDLKGKYDAAIEQTVDKLGVTTSQAKTLFTELGIDTSAEIDKWNQIIDTVDNATEAKKRYAETLNPDGHQMVLSFTDILSNVQSLSKGLDQLDKIYADVYDKEDFDWSSILNNDGFEEVFGDFTDEYNNFVETISNSPDDINACQNAFDKLATAYIYNSDVIKNLTEDTKDAAIAMLKQMGVANADDIVTETLAGKKLAQKAAIDKLNWANERSVETTMASVSALIADAEVTDIAKSALFDLIYQQTIFSNQNLNVSQKISALGKLAAAFGIVADSAQTASGWTDEKTARYMRNGGASDEEILAYFANKYQKQIEDKFASLSSVNYSGGSGSGSSSSKNSTEKETAETFNWIDTKLDALSKKTEMLSDAFSKTFTLNSAQEKYPEYMASIGEEIQANNDAISYYQQKLNEVGLAYEWIAKIQAGAIDISTITDSGLADQIQQYQNYYSQIQSYYDNIKRLEEEREKAQADYAKKVLEAHDLEIESFQKIIDRRKALVSLKETFGFSASGKDLKTEQDAVNLQINRIEEQNRYLNELIVTTTYGSDAWKTYYDRINDNNDSIIDLTQSLADLAAQMANLPLDKLDAYLEKNAAQNELYSAKLDNATADSRKKSLINKQMAIVNKDNKKTQETARTTSVNLSDSISAFSEAKKTDKKYVNDSQKKKIDDYYKKIQSYTKAKKQIPASLITKLSEGGHSYLAQAAANYNAALAANETARETAELSAQTVQTELKELAQQKAALPTDSYNNYLEKNDAKYQLYDEKAANATTAGGKNRLLSKQMNLVTRNNTKAQATAEKTAENLSDSISSLGTAKTSDLKGKTKTQKTEIKSYYKEIQTYTKSEKEIPTSLLTKLSEAGYSSLLKAAIDYNAALAANETAQAAAELSDETTKKELAQLAKAKFDNLQTAYERKQGLNTSKANTLSSKMDLSVAKGYLSSENWYSQLIAYEKKNKSSLKKEAEKLQKQLDDAVARGKVQEGSDEWWDMVDAINATTEAIAQSDVTLQEFVNQLRQVKFDNFDYLQEQISRLTSEADFYIDSMSNKQMTDDGGLTDYGLTAIGLHRQNYDTSIAQANKYGAMIDEINAELAKNPNDTNLIEQLQKYQDAQRQCILNAENEKKAIADLVKEGYESLINSLSKAISKYKELLQNAKNAHDYQKNVSEQSENISALQKQISAYSSMSGNEEIAAKLQKANKELAKAQEDLEETMYEKYISDTQDALDNMLNELEEFVNELYNNIDELFEDGTTSAGENAKLINDTLTNMSNNYGTTLSSSIKSVWEKNYYNPKEGIDRIATAVEKLALEADKQADAAVYDSVKGDYVDLKGYERDINRQQDVVSDLTDEDENTGLQKTIAKTMMDMLKAERDKIGKKKGTNSSEYKEADKKYQDAKKTYNGIKDEYDTIHSNLVKQESILNDKKKEYETAKSNNRSAVKQFLNGVANSEPTKSESEMTDLDKKVLQITGGYITDYNKRQLAELLGTSVDDSDILSALQNLGFKTGGIAHVASGFLGRTGENGLALARNGEGFVSPENVQDIRNLMDFVPDMTEFLKVSLPDYDNLVVNRNANNGDVNISLGDIQMYGVNDPETFSKELVDALKNSSRVQKVIETQIGTSLMSGNSLTVRKF